MLEKVSWCNTILYAQGDMITQKVFSKYLTLHEDEVSRLLLQYLQPRGGSVVVSVIQVV